MAIKGITINTEATEEPHILAEDDAAIYQGLAGEDGVFDVGSRLSASAQTSNTIRISDGVVFVGGHVGRILPGSYENVTIINNTSGTYRHDLIVARLTSTGSGGIDTFELAVITGTPSSTPYDPVYNDGNLYEGDTVRDYPLWRVVLNGLNVQNIEQMFDIVPNLSYINSILGTEKFEYPGQTETQGIYKSPSGYMEIWGTSQASQMSSNSTTGGYSVSITFRETFVNVNPYIYASPQMTNGIPRTSATNVSTTRFTLVTDTNSSAAWINWVAKGAWK